MLWIWDDTSTLGSLFTFVNTETAREDKALCNGQRKQRPADFWTKALLLSAEHLGSLQEFLDIVSQYWQSDWARHDLDNDAGAYQEESIWNASSIV